MLTISSWNIWILALDGLVLVASLVVIVIFTTRLQASMAQAPQLAPISGSDEAALTTKTTPPSTVLSVIIPAYNEAINLSDCVQAVLASRVPPELTLEVWIGDDQSTDDTATIAANLAKTDDRVHSFTVDPRPSHEVWRGKNWACTQAAEQATGEFFLFIDADVRLEPTAIAIALADAQHHQADLLSCAPEILCGCLSEWLVQPLMMALLTVGFQFADLNNPQDPTAFAAGPFMLFRRHAYDRIGGHRAVASEVVEDVELAKRIKHQGFKLRYCLGLGLIKVRMYRSLAALWEGWTKNLYLGSQRSLKTMGLIITMMAMLYLVPWLGVGIQMAVLIGQLRAIPPGMTILGLTEPGLMTWLAILLFGLSLGCLLAQYRLRRETARLFQQPLRYWWLSWLGGGLIAAIAITSVIKTETGWGWTWRGRSLA